MLSILRTTLLSTALVFSMGTTSLLAMEDGGEKDSSKCATLRAQLKKMMDRESQVGAGLEHRQTTMIPLGERLLQCGDATAADAALVQHLKDSTERARPWVRAFQGAR